ncbi:hypothetical protein EDD36DRAFT_60641 [Exophiala viscosa]|uniref:F-box domain-containing protein n=1 Tax=Exophiala viscosa TaxID=2486360 RepID=A0AAN6IAL7_9EURO|nr:hypothetical protein EDD36DRAFT_60641 [Exophiala viscosa]
MLDKIPQEVLEHLILDLGQADLKHLRLANRTLGVKVLPALFRKVSVSILTVNHLRHIAQHPKISDYVEELWYLEMDFSGIATVPGWDQTDHIRNLLGTILEHVAHVKNIGLRPEDFENQEERGGIYTDATTEDHEEGQGDLTEFLRTIPKVIESYNQKAALQSSGYLHESFTFAFQRLPNLRHLVSVEPVSGIATGYLGIEEDDQLRQLHDIFPVDDAVLHTNFRPWQTTWPGHGFIGMWQALCDSHHYSNIQHLEIKRNEDLFIKRGISLSWMDSSLGDQASDGAFRYLRSLKLCLEVTPRPLPSTYSDKLVTALAGASNLRELEISLPSAEGNTQMCLTDILPMTTLPQLRSVTLEEFCFSTMQEINQWLFKHPKLRNLALRRPVLGGSWATLLDLWSARTQFVLDSFELKEPKDYESLFKTNDLDGCQVPSRVSKDALVHYINHGGVNPLKHRRWRRFDSSMDPDGDLDDRLSEFSDMSVWLPDDHPDPVEDSDGPEFDEDYDFDAEEDSDMDVELAGLQANGIDDLEAGEDSDVEMVDTTLL